MRWRLKVLALIASTIGVQLVLLGLCYSNLASFSATKHGAPGDSRVGAGLNGFRSAREVPEVTGRKETASMTWLQDITTVAAVSTTLLEKKNEDLETASSVSTSAAKGAASAKASPVNSNSESQVSKEVEVQKETHISKDRLNRLNPSTMLPHHKDVDDIKAAAEKERRRTFEQLRQKRIEEKRRMEEMKRAEENNRKMEVERKAQMEAERKARKEVEAMQKKETAEEKRNRMLKSIPQREKERSQKLRELYEIRKKQGQKLEETFDKFETHFQGDPLTNNPAQYFKELCEFKVEPLVECSNRTRRELNESEAEGVDILFSMRTTVKYHEERLPLLFETWLSEVDPANVYVVTDGDDEDLTWKLRTLRMNYVNTQTGSSHNISDLCCKAGAEIELMSTADNSKFNWLCHVDDDMYVLLKPLVDTLSRFDPIKEKVYLGRSGSSWEQAREVKQDSGLGTPGQRYHFAVGGMYCLSRAMVDAVKQYLSGCEAFRKSCLLAQEPEDVTVGLVIGAVLGLPLQRTEMIYSHGLDLLSAVPTTNLRDQIAFSYGLGSEDFRSLIPNVVYVPGNIYNLDEDHTQFRSLHCYIHPETDWCVQKRKQELQDRKLAAKSDECMCSWKKFICCQIYKDNHRRYLQEKKKKEREARQAARKAKEKQKNH